MPSPAPELLAEDGLAQIEPGRLCHRWLIHSTLAERLVQAATSFSRETGLPVRIISGHRSIARQLELKRQGRPAADPAVSTHTSCPATGADIRVGAYGKPPRAIRATWGRSAVEAGLRWGGGSKVDPNTGIPSDWNHVDLGPRRG